LSKVDRSATIGRGQTARLKSRRAGRIERRLGESWMICRVDSLADAPLPLLITGVAGVAGYNALHYFRAKYGDQVVGIRPLRNWRLNEPGVVPCDMEDDESLAKLIARYRFAAVLNCAGSCALKSCEMDPLMAWRINVEGLRQLLAVIESRDVRLVHLSIDLVFSGTKQGNHREGDVTDPVTVYGKSMSVAENMIQLARPDAAMLRISLPMGISFNGHAGAIDWIQSRFKKHKPATLYYDEIRTPTYTDCLSRVCQAALARNFAGLYHAGGPRRLSLYQIAQIVNRVGGYDPNHLMGCMRMEAGPMPPRAGDVTMDSSRLADVLGFAPFDPWPIQERWVPTHADWHRERPRGENGSRQLLREILYRNPAIEARA
jgi:dTDP-4-dehydrorhamnose reductase